MHLRFSNTLFDSVWNGEHIDNIQITVSETSGIEGRAGYYEKSGALRDMVQNHLMQILTLIAMEAPDKLDPEEIRNKKVDVLNNLVKYDDKNAKENVILGQYEGYINEDRVDKDSTTETFALIRAFIDNDRWRGVPFYLKTGKKQKRKIAYFVI